jgi:hypothetical protein
MPLSNFIDQCASIMLLDAAIVGIADTKSRNENVDLRAFYDGAIGAVVRRLEVLTKACVRPDGPVLQLPLGLLEKYIDRHGCEVPESVRDVFHPLTFAEYVEPMVGARDRGALRGLRFAGAAGDPLRALWRLELESQGFDHPVLSVEDRTLRVPGNEVGDPHLRQSVLCVRLRLGNERGEAVRELLTSWRAWKHEGGSFFPVAIAYRRCILANIQPAVSLRAMLQAAELPNVLGVFRCMLWPSEDVEAVATFVLDGEMSDLPELVATFAGSWVTEVDLDELSEQMRIHFVRPLSPFDQTLFDLWEGRSHLEILRDPQQMEAFAMLGLTVQVEDPDGLLASSNAALQELLDAWWSELLTTHWEDDMVERLIEVCEATSILRRCTRVI